MHAQAIFEVTVWSGWSGWSGTLILLAMPQVGLRIEASQFGGGMIRKFYTPEFSRYFLHRDAICGAVAAIHASFSHQL